MCMLNLGTFCLALHSSFHLCFEEKFHIFFALMLVARMAECHSGKGCVLELAQTGQLAQEKEAIPVSRIYPLIILNIINVAITGHLLCDPCLGYHSKGGRRHVPVSGPRDF